jgi:hypothetical protein
MLAHKPPTLAGLAADIRLAGFALGIKGGEGEIDLRV